MSTPLPRRRRPAGADHAIHGQRRGFTQQKFGYEAPSDGVDPHLAADLSLTKKVAEKLEQHYPAHPWMVKVTHAQGVVMISLPIVMPRNACHVIHISRIKVDPGLRTVVMAGGEILERYNVPRSGFRLDPFLDARARNPINQTRQRLILPS